jgi:ribokinase
VLPADVVETACRCASFQNSKFILDATGAKFPGDVDSLKHVDIMILGDKELSALAGMEVRSIDDRRKCCISLNSAIKVDYTVIDMEENGCYVYDGKYFEFVMPYDTLPVVDAKGSREAFISALTVAFLRTEDIRQAVDFALAAKALSLSREGGFESLPTEKEVRELQKGAV